ncbi:hypothetical protein U1Q18_027043 [Sarracenia purpurea var. burkii]
MGWLGDWFYGLLGGVFAPYGHGYFAAVWLDLGVIISMALDLRLIRAKLIALFLWSFLQLKWASTRPFASMPISAIPSGVSLAIYMPYCLWLLDPFPRAYKLILARLILLNHSSTAKCKVILALDCTEARLDTRRGSSLSPLPQWVTVVSTLFHLCFDWSSNV